MSEAQLEFEKGYATAVANLISLHGASTEAEETFRQQFDGLEDLDKLELSGYDMYNLKKLF